jgi:hypothetical protein
MWNPKFKRLSYKAIGKKLMAKGSELTVELEAQADGLMRAKEIYSSDFNVQRLTFAQIAMLKSRVNGWGPGRVFLVKDLKMTLPKALGPGAVLTADWEGEGQPPRPGERKLRLSLKCEVKNRYPAKEIHEAITGDAIALDCAMDGAGAGMERRAFLEDFGVMIDLGAISMLSGGTSYRIVRFDVER